MANDSAPSYVQVRQAGAADGRGDVDDREKPIEGSGGSLDPPGPLLEPPRPLPTHLHTVVMACSECVPTRLSPLAERACFSQASDRGESRDLGGGGVPGEHLHLRALGPAWTLSLAINGSIIGVIYERMNVYPENTHTVRAASGAVERPYL